MTRPGAFRAALAGAAVLLLSVVSATAAVAADPTLSANGTVVRVDGGDPSACSLTMRPQTAGAGMAFTHPEATGAFVLTDASLVTGVSYVVMVECGSSTAYVSGPGSTTTDPTGAESFMFTADQVSFDLGAVVVGPDSASQTVTGSVTGTPKGGSCSVVTQGGFSAAMPVSADGTFSLSGVDMGSPFTVSVECVAEKHLGKAVHFDWDEKPYYSYYYVDTVEYAGTGAMTTSSAAAKKFTFGADDTLALPALTWVPQRSAPTIRGAVKIKGAPNGMAKLGATLTAPAVRWANAPKGATVRYYWLRSDCTAACHLVSAGSSRSLTLSPKLLTAGGEVELDIDLEFGSGEGERPLAGYGYVLKITK